MPLSSPPGPRGRLRTGLVLVALLAAACDTAEERAEAHYRRGVELAEAGDLERASLEFRNVFRLNAGHGRARLDYARLLRDSGDLEEALVQYRRLADGDRSHVEGHRELAELALRLGAFDMLEEAADRAHRLAPDDPMVQALKATADFRRGRQAEALAMADAVIAEAPEILPAHMVGIAERMAAADWPAALARADAALAVAPEDEGLHLARLSVLEAAGDTEAAGEALVRMAALFPDNGAVARALVGWHLGRGDAAAAEAVLRAAAARTPELPDGHLAVVQLLFDTAGPEAARAELDRLIEAADDPRPFRRARATLDFAAGDEAEAIAGMEALIAEAEPSDARRDLEVTLAAMLRETGEREHAAAPGEGARAAAPGEEDRAAAPGEEDRAAALGEEDRAAALGARERAAALVASVLEADPTHVEALKLSARDHLDADRPEAAVADLRTALGQAPRDAEIMTILATAHAREGAHELAAERLALAAEISGYAPAESLRHARMLVAEGRTGPAEDVLVRALRRAPEHRELLAALGGVHLARGDAARARQVAGLLAGLGDPAAMAAASGLEMAALEHEGRTEETVAMLERLAADPAAAGGGLAAQAELVRTHLAAGDTEAAEAAVAALLAADPDDLAGRMMAAGLAALRGDTEAAETAYRALAAAAPTHPEPHGALFALLAGLGRAEEARAALRAGIEATGSAVPGGHPQLRFLEAGLRETEADFEGAIAIYEALYARDRDDPVIANNLASLLATHRDDAESLERAHLIARRLRGAALPHFQDTYGWILARRGQPAEALAYLEPAAAALGQDPLVQYHLGMAYLALERREAARDALARAVDLAGPESALPQIADARTRLAGIAEEPDSVSQ